MGIESFYVNIKIENFSADNILCFFQKKQVFESAFSYHWDDTNQELSIQAALVSFLPACELLYELCKMITQESRIIEIESRRTTHLFDFNSFTEFFTWIYSCWGEKLEYFNNNWGAFIVKPTDYYKARRKLRKKYMQKY